MNRITPAVSLSLFALFNAQITLANSDYIDASKSIIDQQNQRFDELRNQVIPPYPTHSPKLHNGIKTLASR